MMTKRLGWFVVTCGALLAAACTPVGSGQGPGTAPPTPDVAPERTVPNLNGAWTGFLSVEGENLQSNEYVPDLDDVYRFDLEAPGFELRATGTGRVELDGAIRADLQYETTCPGVARLRGSLEADGLALSGPLTVEDCTGSASGTFLFNR